MTVDLTKKSPDELRQLAQSKDDPRAAAARTELGNRRKAEENANKKSPNRPNTPTGRR